MSHALDMHRTLAADLGSALARLDAFASRVLALGRDNLSRDVWLTLREYADGAIDDREFVSFVNGCNILEILNSEGDDAAILGRVVAACNGFMKAISDRILDMEDPRRPKVARAIVDRQILACYKAAHRVRALAASGRIKR